MLVWPYGRPDVMMSGTDIERVTCADQAAVVCLDGMVAEDPAIGISVILR
jgi:hypothetical protein